MNACGWVIQVIKQANLHEGISVAVKEYRKDGGPADYVIFVDSKPCGLIDAKRAEEDHKLNEYEDQTEGYSLTKLKHQNNNEMEFPT